MYLEMKYGNISAAILLLIQENYLSVSGKRKRALSTGSLPVVGLPRNVTRITDCPDITLAVDHGCKTLNQPTNQQYGYHLIGYIVVLWIEFDGRRLSCVIVKDTSWKCSPGGL